MKHLIFDLDGTLTESRQQMSIEMLEKLATLSQDIVVISGAERKRIEYQLNGFEPEYILAQSGSECKFWKRTFTERDNVEVLRHIKSIQKYFKIKDREDLVQHRGCQISFSFLGHNMDMELKKDFDPNGSQRRGTLQIIPFFSNNLEVRIAGTTCLDYTYKDSTKGKNIQRLLRHLDWKKEDCVYFGDSTFSGGNDETVVGIIKTVQVDGPEDLLMKLQKYV